MSEIKKVQTTGGMSALLNTDTGEYKVEQDATPYIEQAKRDREAGRVSKDVGYKKACTIPDIVAVELLYKYKIDIHAPEFMNDPASVRKVLGIIKSEYPYLMSY
jgi:hypothetical protein